MGQLAEHVANHPFLAMGLVATLVAVVVFEIRQRSQGQSNVSANDAVRLINHGAVVIDVRKPAEYQEGHIVNSKNVELTEIGPEQSLLKKQKNKVLITVCDTGMSSGRAAATLRKAGFDKVFSLKGGLHGWRAENLPLVK
jgi:rhodanese-related sulfurtransferase